MTHTDLQGLLEEATPLPCPFCGGEGHVGTIVYTRSPYVDDQCKDQLTYWQVNCSGCIATVRGIAGYRTEADAIEAWNQRADLAAKDARIAEAREDADALAEALDEISDMLMARPDMVRALQPLIGWAEKATMARAAGALQGHLARKAARALHQSPEEKGV